MSKPVTIDLDALLDYITANIFDYWHGLGPTRDWSISATGVMDHLRGQLGMSETEMGIEFDKARVRVHGDKAEL